MVRNPTLCVLVLAGLFLIVPAFLRAQSQSPCQLPLLKDFLPSSINGSITIAGPGQTATASAQLGIDCGGTSAQFQPCFWLGPVVGTGTVNDSYGNGAVSLQGSGTLDYGPLDGPQQ